MRTRDLVALVVICDAIVLFAGVPLERASWLAVTQHEHDRRVLVELLCANVLLMGVCLLGFSAAAAASVRGFRWFQAFFQSLRATHAKVVNETAAINRNNKVSSSTTPAN